MYLQVSQEEPNLIRTENRIVATGKTKETVAEIAAGRDVVPQTSASKPLQKEWKQKKLNACKVRLIDFSATLVITSSTHLFTKH